MTDTVAKCGMPLCQNSEMRCSKTSNRIQHSFTFHCFSMHLGVQSGPCEEELIRLDEAYVQDKYKVGLLYCREGQQSEEEMYNNEEGGAAFKEFLDLIGQRVRLKDFNKYKGGLCNKSECSAE